MPAIAISENVAAELDLQKYEDFNDIEDGEFFDWVSEPGRYLAKCLKVDSQDDGTHKPSENLLFKVVGGTHKTQNGKMFMERIYHTAIDRLLKLGKRLSNVPDVWDETKHAEFVEAMQSGEPANGPDFAPCLDREFVIVLKKDKDKQTGKESIRMDYVGMFSADDERVKDFVAGVRGESGGGVDSNGGAPAEKAAATPAAKTAAKNPPAKGTAGKPPARTAASVNSL